VIFGILKKANIDEFDAVVLPGGFGAAKNLCNYATKRFGLRIQS